MPRRVFLIGDVGGDATYHLGDEAMLQANIERLREMCPRAELTVASHDPAWTARRYGVRAVPRPNLSVLLRDGEPNDTAFERLVTEALEPQTDDSAVTERPIPVETVRALAESDALLVSGGGNLNASWPEQLYERVILLEMADRLGVKAVVTGQTLGPHLQPRHRELLRRVLSRLPLVGVREEYSRGVAHLLGVAPHNLARHLDDAFFGPRFGSATGAETIGETTVAGGRPWIAVTVTRLPGPMEPFAEQLRRIARETGCRLIFVPHAKAPDADVEVSAALVDLLVPEIEAEAVPVPLVEEGRWLVERAELVLSMRYHPLVFAVAGGVPGLGLYVDEYTRVKLRGVLGHGGLGDWALPIEMALSGSLGKAGLDLWRHREKIRRHLAAQTGRWEANERSYGSRLSRALGIETGREDETPVDDDVAPAPGPSGAWSGVARMINRRSDLWFTERLQLLEQVDTAVEYALSLERTLIERDQEIEGLKRLMELHAPVQKGDDVGAETPQ